MAGRETVNSDDTPTSSDLHSGSDTHRQQGPESGEDSLDARTVVAGRPGRKAGGKGRADQTVVYRPDHSPSKDSPPAPEGPKEETEIDSLEAPTEVLGDSQSLSGQEEERTGVYRPSESSPPGARDSGAASAGEWQDADAMDDPLAGWLVIVAGPGRGSICTLGYGRNPIGRNSTERVPLSYGDEMISRSNHAVITYDPEGKKFYIQQGQGTNLVYVDDSPVLEAQILEPLTHIKMGRTTLRFVPLCGDLFDWSQAE